jgi:hypothetical protein
MNIILFAIRFFFQKSPVIRKNLNEQELDNIWDEKQLQILVSIIIINMTVLIIYSYVHLTNV